jgi:hypothetical protein
MIGPAAADSLAKPLAEIAAAIDVGADGVEPAGLDGARVGRRDAVDVGRDRLDQRRARGDVDHRAERAVRLQRRLHIVDHHLGDRVALRIGLRRAGHGDLAGGALDQAARGRGDRESRGLLGPPRASLAGGNGSQDDQPGRDGDDVAHGGAFDSKRRAITDARFAARRAQMVAGCYRRRDALNWLKLQLDPPLMGRSSRTRG